MAGAEAADVFEQTLIVAANAPGVRSQRGQCGCRAEQDAANSELQARQ